MNLRRNMTLLAVACTSLSASCSERQLARDVEEPRIRCAPIVAHIELPGEDSFRLYDSNTGLNFDRWCTCTTHEQWLGEDEPFLEWVNEMSYEACLEFVEREGYDPAYSSCLTYYEDGYWTLAFGIAEHSVVEDPEFCEPYNEPAGCGVE